ncbi:hypothetical protein QGN29_03055 [Temperatibacter marinus]|uniref:Uncharacterized protein n=1 Tax=Temperatibacter marinus TaxID=1456591 RepID=A0AA52EHN7_9PROT|nr:hypothetical protein [Temperatibacter marinus]WND03348.1 hypothetical protein QGN29_03055 [Temperatibacter marinus]
MYKELFNQLKKIYFSGDLRSFKKLLTSAPSGFMNSDYLRYLTALVNRHECKDRSLWQKDYDTGLSLGLRQTYSNPKLSLDLSNINENQHILICAEEGLGDFIRHLFYVNKIIELGCKVSLLVPPKIKPLVQYNFHQCNVVSEIPDVVYDIILASGSLEGLFWDKQDGAQGSGYLKAEEISLYPNKLHKAIGVCTTSTKVDPVRALNYTTLVDYGYLFQEIEFTCVSLQYSHDLDEIREAESTFSDSLIHFPSYDFFNDINTLAFVISQLDKVISTSTLVADLSNALGIYTYRIHTLDTQYKAGNSRSRQCDRLWYGQGCEIVYKYSDESWEDFMRILKKIVFPNK